MVGLQVGAVGLALYVGRNDVVGLADQLGSFVGVNVGRNVGDPATGVGLKVVGRSVAVYDGFNVGYPGRGVGLAVGRTVGLYVGT